MIVESKMDIINNKPKKMDVDKSLHIRINSLQSKLFEKFRVKIKIKDITDECIIQGLPLAEKSIEKKLYNELIITPLE